MNLDELRPILHGYRKQLEAAWSPATAHEDYEGRQGDPTGQCGVTSAWLQRRLAEDHGITAIYCTGTAYHLGDDESFNHCWLEIGEGWNRVIVDLTADQIDGLHDSPVICATFPELCSGYVSYIYGRRMTAATLLADPVQARLSILTEALS